MPYNYTNNLYNTGIFEFSTFYSGDLEDLEVTGSGSGVHLYEDVFIDFEFIDRTNNSVDSTRGFLNNPFIDYMGIDILDIEGNDIETGYLNSYKRSSFSFPKNENISIFGSYAKNFGLRANVFDYDGNKYSSEFYFYGNPLQISGLTITEETGTYSYSEPYDDKTEVLSYSLASPTTGQLFVEASFLNDTEFTKYDHLDVYWASGSGQFSTGLNESFLSKKVKLTNTQTQGFTLSESNLPQSESIWLTVVPYSSIGSGSAWTVGPCKFQETIKPENPFSLKSESVLLYGDQVASGNKIFIGEQTIIGGSGHNIESGTDGNNIAGGRSNSITGSGSFYNFVGGGSGNNIESGSFSSSFGGHDNDLTESDYSIIAGGENNLISKSESCSVGGGSNNNVDQSIYSSTIGGFDNDLISVTGSAHIGGEENIISNSKYSTILGGQFNDIDRSDHSIIYGGVSNTLNDSNNCHLIGSYIDIDSSDSVTYLSDSVNRVKNVTGDYNNTLFIDFSNGINMPTGGITTNGDITTNGGIVVKPPSSAPTVSNGQLAIEATNNTTLTFKLRGSDGVLRSGILNLS